MKSENSIYIGNGGSKKHFRENATSLPQAYSYFLNHRCLAMIFYAGLTIELGMVIIDKSNYINPIEGWLFRITFLIFACKVALTKYSWKEWCLIAVLEAVGIISYKVTGKNEVIRIVTFVAACKDIPLKQMLRYTFYVTLIGCAVIIFLSVSGIYGAMSLTIDYGREYDALSRTGVEQTRYTLGMGHPNALSCMFLMLLALGIYVFSERMKWYVYLFLMLINVGVYGLTDSKTSMLIATLLLGVSFLMTYCSFFREKAAVYVCGCLVFLLCLGFSVDAAANAQKVRQAQWNETYLGHLDEDAHIRLLLKVDSHINGRIISLTDTANNDGTLSTWSVFSCPNNMEHYFDMGWVKLFYRYGIIPGMIYCIACFGLLWQFYRRKDAFGLAVFTVFSIYSIMEAHLFSFYIGRNFLLMMMGSYFFSVHSIDAVNKGKP